MSSPIRESDLGLGIDQYRPESKLASGFCTDLLNGLASATGSIIKRRGCRRAAGFVPVRVAEYRQSSTGPSYTIELEFPAEFDVSELESCPIVVAGRTTLTDGSIQRAQTYLYASGFTVVDAQTISFDQLTGPASPVVEENPEISIFGLDLQALKGSTAASRFSWVSYVGSYVTTGQSNVLTVSQGVLHATRSADEVGRSTAFVPEGYADITETMLAATYVIGPALFDVTPLLVPARGAIITAPAGMNRVPVVSAVYNAGPETTTYRLYAPAFSLVGAATVDDVIRPDVDCLTVEQCGWDVLNGRFLVVSASADGLDHILVEVDNTANAASDAQKSDTGIRGQGSVNTDLIPSLGTFPAGSRIHSDVSAVEAATLEVLFSSVASAVVTDLVDPIDIDSAVMWAEYVSTDILVNDVEGWLIGDEVLVSSDGRLRTVVAVDIPNSIVTLDEDCTIVTADPATRTSFSVERRWFPAASAYNPALTRQPSVPTNVRHFEQSPYDDQPFILGAQVNKSMYLTNGVDPVKKFDGTRIYDAGLVNIPGIVTIKTKLAQGAIVNPSQRIPYVSRTQFSLTVADGDEDFFTSGERVYVQSRLQGLGTGTFLANNVIIQSVPTGNNGEPNAVGPYVGMEVSVATATGVLPTGLTDGATYYIGQVVHGGSSIFVGDTWTLALYTTRANALAGGATGLVIITTGGTAGWKLYSDVTERNFGDIPSCFVTGSSNNGVVGTVTVDADLDFRLQFASTLTPDQIADEGYIWKTTIIKYDVKVRGFDAQGSLTYSAGMQSQDLTMPLGPAVAVDLSILNYPELRNMDLARLEVEVYRTGGLVGAPPYMLVYAQSFDYTKVAAYIRVTDTVQFDQLVDDTGTALGTPDPNAALRGGVDNGTAFDRPPVAKSLTSLDSRLVLGNIKSPHRMEVAFRRRSGAPAVGASLTGTPSFTLVRGVSTIPTTPQDVGPNVFTYCGGQFNYPSNAGLFDSITITQFDDYFEIAPVGGVIPGVVAGDWTYLAPVGGPGGNRRAGAPYTGWFQVREVIGGNLRVYQPGTSIAGTFSATSFFDATTVAEIGELNAGDPVYVTGAADSGQLRRRITYYAGTPNTTTGEVRLYQTPVDAITATGAITGSGAPVAFTLHRGDVDTFPTALIRMIVTQSGVVPIPRPTKDYASTNQNLNYSQMNGNATKPGQSYEDFLARRFADAINASQVATDRFDFTATTGADMTTFEPFIYARAGNDIGYGKVIIESFKADEAFGFILSSVNNNTDGMFDVYVNGVLIERAGDLAALTADDIHYSERLLFPSRLLRSYSNYPEVFHSPYAVSANDSDSAMDISPDDGQAIIAVIPFYGVSFSTAAQQNQQLVVFKERSIYIVDVRTKQVDFVESNGQGCTFPRSVVETYQGIEFANESGVYVLRRDKTIQNLGQNMTRLWQEQVGPTTPRDSIVGYNDTYDNLTKMSLPVAGEVENSEVHVYDYTREEDRLPGAWNRFDNQPFTSWSNFSFDTYMGSYDGRVYMERRDGVARDYRDDVSPISMSVKLRPMNFDSPGIRKQLSSMVLSFRTLRSLAGMVIRAATDLDNVFRDCDLVLVTRPTQTTGIGDLTAKSVGSIEFTIPVSKFEYLQVEVANAALDEGVELCEIVYNVLAGNEKGILQAAQTTVGT